MTWLADGWRAPAESWAAVDNGQVEEPVAADAGPRAEGERGAALPGADLAAKALRLAELQEELYQLERQPTLPSGAMDGGVELMAGSLPTHDYERVLELECEIEMLREELAGEDVHPREPAPGAAEAVDAEIRSRETGEPWSETDEADAEEDEDEVVHLV